MSRKLQRYIRGARGPSRGEFAVGRGGQRSPDGVRARAAGGPGRPRGSRALMTAAAAGGAICLGTVLVGKVVGWAPCSTQGFSH